LKQALVDTGVYVDEDDLETKQLQLKLDFKKTDFYKKGRVVYNKRVEKDYGNVKSFDDLGVKKKNYKHQLSSGFGKVSSAFFELEQEYEAGVQKQKDIKLSEIPNHIIRFALTQYPFFHFSNIVSYFPNIGSLSNFIEGKDYIGGLEVTFRGTQKRLNNLTNLDYLFAIQGLLEAIESEIKSNLTEYEGSDYINDYVRNVFKDKEIKVYKDSERSDGQEELVANEPWYLYNANYGTSEEKQFVEMFDRRFEHLEKKFENIYLIRNEREVKIFDKIGRAFEPDFILFCKQKEGEELTYQVFIEPKGNHLKSHDKWKEEFLEEIRKESRTIEIDTDKYLITGVPFYNNENENEFKETLEKTLNE